MNIKGTMQIIRFSLKSIAGIEKKRICFAVLNTILEIIHSFVFGVLFFKFFLSTLFEKQIIQETIFLILVQLIWQAFYAYYKDWYANIYIARSDARIQEAVYRKLFHKTVTMDMKSLESPAYLDSFQMVMQKSAEAVLQVTNSFFSYLKNIMLLLLNGCLFFTYKPSLFIFVILSVIFTYFTDIVKNRYQIEKNKELNPLRRKFDYYSVKSKS